MTAKTQSLLSTNCDPNNIDALDIIKRGEVSPCWVDAVWFISSQSKYPDSKYS